MSFQKSIPALLAGAALLAPVVGHSQEEGSGVIRTSPSLSQLAPTMAAERVAKSEQKIAKATLKRWGSGPQEDFLWLLSGDKVPMPLNYVNSAPLGGLQLQMYSASEMRLMFPGELQRKMDAASYTLSKFVQNAHGQLHQIRSRDLERLTAWKARLGTQIAGLSTEWEQYAFSKRLYSELESYTQAAERSTSRMVADFRKEIDRNIPELTRYMHDSGSYDLQMVWYEMIQKLATGWEQFAATAEDYDYRVAATVQDIEAMYPKLSVPSSTPPVKPKPGAEVSITPPVGAIEPSVMLAPVEPDATRVPAVAVEQEETSTGLLGWLLAVAVAGLMGWGLLTPLLKRKKAKI